RVPLRLPFTRHRQNGLYDSNLDAPASPPASAPVFDVAGGDAGAPRRSRLAMRGLPLSSLIVGVAVSACFGLLYLFDPSQHAFYPRCQFHALTGLYCPGCGSLRAMHQLLLGHIPTAFHLNALFLLALSV